MALNAEDEGKRAYPSSCFSFSHDTLIMHLSSPSPYLSLLTKQGKALIEIYSVLLITK